MAVAVLLHGHMFATLHVFLWNGTKTLELVCAAHVAYHMPEDEFPDIYQMMNAFSLS